ncbi:hypothetical protein GQ607_017279 [Colletotrichum asianum]|uniref:Uncharacterized protein n=1 Tax=Colletotrichum asianum TaxID=702518 RepID=A0A8H3VX18_9PEZI|nr:hypothetical protein GQ607_017279 [Colletotrichum asianum]
MPTYVKSDHSFKHANNRFVFGHPGDVVCTVFVAINAFINRLPIQNIDRRVLGELPSLGTNADANVFKPNRLIGRLVRSGEVDTPILARLVVLEVHGSQQSLLSLASQHELGVIEHPLDSILLSYEQLHSGAPFHFPASVAVRPSSFGLGQGTEDVLHAVFGGLEAFLFCTEGMHDQLLFRAQPWRIVIRRS